MPVPSDPYASLVSWLETDHEDFYSALVCRNVSGAGRGMFVSRDIAGGETLLQVPASALLNPLTLRISPLNTIPAWVFPLTAGDRSVGPTKRRRQSLTPARLDTTQLLALHLLLSRDPAGRHVSAWQSYFATLPDFEGWHPLTWFYGGRGQGGNRGWDELLGCLIVEAKEKLREVKRRYMDDCEVLKGVLREEEPFAEQDLLSMLTESDFLWAWLNVNTRTVSIPLDIPGNPSLQNHTLVPVLDMLNHTSCSTAQIPHPRQFPSSSTVSAHTRAKVPAATGPRPRIPSRDVGPLIPGKIGFRLVAPHKGLRAGDEVLFEYGSHSSAMLFAEYGFVEGPYGGLAAGDVGPGREGERRLDERSGKGGMDGSGWLKKEHGCVDLGDLVKDLWLTKGMTDEDRSERVEVLGALSCMNRHVIHTTPSPPHPSHALLMALRVLHLPPHSPKLNPIRSGRVCYISQANESATLQSLHAICLSAHTRAIEGLKRVQTLRQRADNVRRALSESREVEKFPSGNKGRKPQSPPRFTGIEGLDDGVWSGLEDMWQEEMEVVGAVLRRIDRGETDW